MGSLTAALVTSLASLPRPAAAFQAQPGRRPTFELAAGPAARAARLPTHGLSAAPQAAAPALRRFTAAFGRADILWDPATGVPLRIWAMQRSTSADLQAPAAAQRHARELLAAHIDLLAPGSRPSDFILAADDLSSGIRSLGFVQHYHGRPVLGGQLSLRYKHGRLAMLASEALPHVRAVLTDSPVDADTARARARAWILADATTATAGAVDGPFILPIVDAERVREYREVLRVIVRAEQPIGKWAVYVDAATGAPVAREQQLRFASGTVLVDAPIRGPLGARANFAASNMNLFVNGAPAVADLAGVVDFADGPPAAVVAGVAGTFIAVQNQVGANATTDLSLAPGGAALWAAPQDEQLDAQLSGYIHADRVKQFVRGIAPDFAFLAGQMPVNVNIDDICNAFADGETVNFFLADITCQNTARIADVVYHEFGHNVHIQGIIPGVGFVDPALSEGIADFLSATIVDDSALAPGFFLGDDAPLRELDPSGAEWHWPEDNGEAHDAGRIIGGALWDLRKALRKKLGAGPGTTLVDKMWFESIRRAVDMPTMYPEVLLVDDDDGDLSNGTPNECEINVAFDVHGLVGPSAFAADVVAGAPSPAGLPVDLVVSSQPKACLDLTPTGAELLWRVRGSDEQGTVPMFPGPAGFSGVIPNPGDGKVVEYQIQLGLKGSPPLVFPKNLADPEYEVYFGPVTPIFCTGFESSPAGEGWGVEGDWAWGPPPGGADPDAAFTGSAVAGNNLTAPGTYDSLSFRSMISPPIDVAGFPTVRLQLRRWLEVEDSTFDQAQIAANGQTAWLNASSFDGNLSHIDGEWRFQDVDLTPFVQGGQVQLEFTLSSDEFLEFGGWNLDELCVVGTDEAPPTGSCGDGLTQPPEQCDNGPANSDTQPNACRTSCRLPACGDGVVDAAEQCDDGGLVGGDGCSAVCTIETVDPTGGIDPTTGPATDGTDTDDTAGTGPGEDDLVDHGCTCTAERAADPSALALALAGLLGLRRRRSSATGL